MQFNEISVLKTNEQFQVYSAMFFSGEQPLLAFSESHFLSLSLGCFRFFSIFDVSGAIVIVGA